MIRQQEYESLGVEGLLGERGHARNLFGKAEQMKVAEEISKLLPFQRNPTRAPINYDFDVIGLWELPDVSSFADLIDKKKDLYKDYRTP